MTYVSKFRGSEKVVACYVCPEHGEIDVEVTRDAQGNAPDKTPCPIELGVYVDRAPDSKSLLCELEADWTASASLGYRVRRIEVVRGKWEPPERKTYLDTRKLGEGQSIEEFRAERKKVWAERRRQTVKELLR